MARVLGYKPNKVNQKLACNGIQVILQLNNVSVVIQNS